MLFQFSHCVCCVIVSELSVIVSLLCFWGTPSLKHGVRVELQLSTTLEQVPLAVGEQVDE